VEDGLLTAEQWRPFTFDNPVEMLTRVNPSFFDGTAVAPPAPRNGTSQSELADARVSSS
jgi:hypothetical protein